MYNKNRPNINPADNESMAGLLQFTFSEMMKSIQTLLPAKVIKYDRANNRVQVQLLINIVGTSGEVIQNTQIASIPVMLLGGGGFFVSFNLNEGDLGWVFATDRDISLFLQSYKAEAPAVNLIKNFSSSFFIPDVMKNYGVDSENAVISSTDGAVSIELSSDTITLTAPNVVINGKAQCNYIVGDLYVEGNIQAQGTITPDVPPPP